MRLIQLREGYAFTRLLIEMALASNAPTRLKVKVGFIHLQSPKYHILIVLLFSVFACSLQQQLLSSRTSS